MPASTVLPILLLLAAPLAADPPADKLPTDLAGNDAVKKHIETFQGRGEVGDFNLKPLSPEESLKAFTVADGYHIETVLHEPTVMQPLAIDFDERGRMWVVQYKQYPFPAGLKIVRYDEHLRAQFDKIPAAPGQPGHVPGADEITIHEDTDGDGKYDKHKTFVTGLNIATSVLRGRGGVWVANPPYLLFYPDANNDDVPDGPPQIHLTGFGLEDTHAVMNSLRWGPDGWIYGAQGSTCWATVSSEKTKNVHFKGQAIWRYHPQTKVFEVFAEGGGNTFCVEFDAKGRCYSGTNWGALRGVYYMQGGRYVKGWGKHGPLMNPYSFGYFEHMPHEGYQPRFSHSLIIYEGGAMPALEGKMVSIIPLHNRIQVSDLIPYGSGFKTKDTIALVESKDRWFRPVDIKAGPDGAIYIADWYDTRLTHVDPRDNWDKTHGRIYRIAANVKPTGAHPPLTHQPAPAADLSQLKSAELVERLKSPNKWERQTVQRLLADRPDAALVPALVEQSRQAAGQVALELFWAAYVSGGKSSSILRPMLSHPDAHVRRWAVRLAGDHAMQEVCPPLYTMGSQENDLEVLAQMAASSQRFSFGYCAREMLKRDELAKDPYIPLLLWWAVESKLSAPKKGGSAELWVKLMTGKDERDHAIVKDTILPRLAQRLAADPTDVHIAALANLLDSAATKPQAQSLLKGVQAAGAGGLPRQPALAASLDRLITLAGDAGDPSTIILRLRAGDEKALAAATEFVLNDDQAVKLKRIEMIEALGQVGKAQAVPALLKVARTSQWHSVRRASLSALQRFNDPKIGEEIVAAYNDLPKDQGVRPRAIDTLTKRKEWSLALMKAVDEKKIARAEVDFEYVERMKLHKEEELTKLIRKTWGRTRATADQKLKKIEEVRGLVAANDGDAKKGKAIFATSCAVCHKLHDQGPPGATPLAPDLTGYERDNLDYMLLAVIDPSAAIREEFVNYEIETKDGLLLTGFLLEQNPRSVTIQDGVEGKVVLPRDQIVSLKASTTSRMPEQLLDALKPDDVKNLFTYLRSKQPVK
jgi:putative heme-binding domain-containing protein